jgi:hypothetical protein
MSTTFCEEMEGCNEVEQSESHHERTNMNEVVASFLQGWKCRSLAFL